MLKDIRIKLDGKSFNSNTEYVNFALYVPEENRERQIKVFPMTNEWGIDLTVVRNDIPLPTSRSYYGGRDFKNRKYVFVENLGGKFEIVFTDSKRKFEKFVSDRVNEENDFLEDLKKNAKKHLN